MGNYCNIVLVSKDGCTYQVNRSSVVFPICGERESCVWNLECVPESDNSIWEGELELVDGRGSSNC